MSIKWIKTSEQEPKENIPVIGWYEEPTVAVEMGWDIPQFRYLYRIKYYSEASRRYEYQWITFNISSISEALKIPSAPPDYWMYFNQLKDFLPSISNKKEITNIKPFQNLDID